MPSLLSIFKTNQFTQPFIYFSIIPILSHQEYVLYEGGDPKGIYYFDVNAKGEISTKRLLNYVVGEVIYSVALFLFLSLSTLLLSLLMNEFFIFLFSRILVLFSC